MCFALYSLLLTKRHKKKVKCKKESVYLYEETKVNRDSNLGLKVLEKLIASVLQKYGIRHKQL